MDIGHFDVDDDVGLLHIFSLSHLIFFPLLLLLFFIIAYFCYYEYSMKGRRWVAKVCISQYWLYATHVRIYKTRQANFIELNWNQYGKMHDLLQMIYFNTDAALDSAQQIAFRTRNEGHREKRKAIGKGDGPMPETIKIARFHYFNSINHIVSFNIVTSWLHYQQHMYLCLLYLNIILLPHRVCPFDATNSNEHKHALFAYGSSEWYDSIWKQLIIFPCETNRNFSESQQQQFNPEKLSSMR